LPISPGQQHWHPRWAVWPIRLRLHGAIVPCVMEEPKEEEDVNDYADFDRYEIGERNEGFGREAQTPRPEKRLRRDGEPNSGLRLAALVAKGTLPLLRRAGLAGWTEAAMGHEEIVIYARVRSRSCRRVRRLLERKGYAFEEMDVGDDEELRARLIETTGRTAVPLVFLGGRLVGGLEEIEALDRSGDLDRLLQGRV
jgi:glutaredoxin 3